MKWLSLEMAKLTTRIALRLLLTSEDYLLRWMKAGYSKEDRARYKYRLEHDQLSVEKKEELLEKCGFTVAVENSGIDLSKSKHGKRTTGSAECR